MNEDVRGALRCELQPWMHVLVLGVSPEWLAGIAVRLATASLRVPLPAGPLDAILLGAEHLATLQEPCLARLGPRGRLFILRPETASPPQGWTMCLVAGDQLAIWQREERPATPDLRMLRAQLADFLDKPTESRSCDPEALFRHAMDERIATTQCLATVLVTPSPRDLCTAAAPQRSQEELVVLLRHVRRQTLALIDQFIANMTSLDAREVRRVIAALERQRSTDEAFNRS